LVSRDEKGRVTLLTGEVGCLMTDTLTADLTLCRNVSIELEEAIRPRSAA
jgi:hypothetical protein